MRTLAALAVPGTWSHPGGILVGRTVANAALLEALCRWSSIERVLLLAGEQADGEAVAQLTSPWKLPAGRVGLAHVLQLPRLLEEGAVDVLHHPSHVERLFDLIAARDRWATRAVPVTGQIHSLSYPRLHQDFARWPLLAPSSTDAIFCSSTQGRRALESAFSQVERSYAELGVATPLPRFSLPHVPLGVTVDALSAVPRAEARASLGIPAKRVVLLTLARFTEFDKLDAFPLLQAFAALVHEHRLDVHLVMAGARQGTRTPEMLGLWARLLRIDDRVTSRVDFPEAEKRMLLSAADLFVSPVDNVQETFGQSVIEAMAAGLPVVTSDFDGYKDTVDDEVGRRVPTRLGVDWSTLSELGPLLYERPLHLLLGQSIEVELPALTATLAELVRDGALRQRLGHAAHQRARARYDWPVVVKQLDAEWRRLSAQPFTRSHRAHPLKLDLAETFAHFPTSRIEPGRVVSTTALGRSEQSWVIYPELAVVLADDDVRAALEFCRTPRLFSELEGQLSSRLGLRDPWVASFIATWLVKHGLLGTP